MKQMFFSKYIFLSAVLVFILLVGVSNSFAAESFYARLEILEKKAGIVINFSLEKSSALYGNYESFYDIYDEAKNTGEYILETYNENKEAQAKYPLRSSRFVFWDGEDTGGIIESDEGTISTVIPYDRQKPAGFIKIDNNGIKTDFIPIPVAQLEEEFKNIPLCKREDEAVDLDNSEKCCSGLIPAQQDDGLYKCVNCGDGECSQYENYRSCYIDCPIPGTASVKTEYMINYPFLILLVIIFAAVVIFIIFLVKKRKV